MVEVKLKNSDEVLLMDQKVYDYLSQEKNYQKWDMLNKIRLHSSGCAVFQKTISRKKRGGKPGEKSSKIKTFYLHRLIAELFKPEGQTKTNSVVSAINGNKLDCQLDNIVWRSRSVASRKRKTTNDTGYRGVYKEKKSDRYRAVIAVDGRSIHIGMYATPEEAAMAYNKKSKELFGEDGKINIIQK